MKSIILTCLSATLSISSLSAESEDFNADMPLGFESVTGFRSDYIHRGFELGESIFDFQVSGEAMIRDNVSIGYSAWYATETSSGDFSETGFKLSTTTDLGNSQWSNSLTYRSLSNSALESGVDFTTKYSRLLATGTDDNSSHTISFIGSYDTGAQGWYGAVEYGHYKPLDKNSYLSFKTGVSLTENYYDRSGFNDLYARISYTYHLTKQVSISPFLGTSLQLDTNNGSDHLYGGLWFEVSF